jgi:REP element-mobilizing transposase RayT
MKNQIYYKRHLPHYQPEGYTFFVTFRLNGSLPLNIIQRLKDTYAINVKKVMTHNSKKQKNIKYGEVKWNYFENFDQLLARNKSVRYLENGKIAEAVCKAITFRDKIIYDLICFTIMPNHVHIVFTPIDSRIKASTKEKSKIDEAPLRPTSNENVNRSAVSTKEKRNTDEASASPYIVTKILQDLKSKTAIECNKLLNRKGTFWQHESYDHVIRNETELNRIIEYVLNNPVKAGLVNSPDEWKWNYYKYL